MKGFILMVLLLLTNVIHAQQYFNKISLYADIGQEIPVGAFKASQSSDRPLEIALKEPFGKSFSINTDIFILKRLGITAGTSFYGIQPDKSTFERMHGNPSKTESYLRDYDLYMLHAGLKSRFMKGRFSAEPALSVGLTITEADNAEVYFLNDQNEIFREISYQYNKAFLVSFIGSVNLYGEIIKLNHLHVGIHCTVKTVYMNPEITQTTNISDKIANEIKETTSVYRQPMCLFYYGIGLSMKFGNNL